MQKNVLKVHFVLRMYLMLIYKCKCQIFNGIINVYESFYYFNHTKTDFTKNLKINLT